MERKQFEQRKMYDCREVKKEKKRKKKEDFLDRPLSLSLIEGRSDEQAARQTDRNYPLCIDQKTTNSFQDFGFPTNVLRDVLLCPGKSFHQTLSKIQCHD